MEYMVTAKSIFTVGHGRRSAEEFKELIKEYSILRLFDVRTLPHSRFNPQFNREVLSAGLKSEGIEYVHMKELGGLRKEISGFSGNGAKSGSSRGFEDYMMTRDFKEALLILEKLAVEKRSVIMCAETSPVICHRFFLADALRNRGFEVIHILGPGRSQVHPRILSED